MASKVVMMTTIRPVIRVSRRVGQTILAVSARTCRKNSPGFTLATLRTVLHLVLRWEIGPNPAFVQPRLGLGSPCLRKAETAVQAVMAGVEGLEPTALGFGDRCSTS